MSSRRRASAKAHPKRFVPDGSSSQYSDVEPKEECMAHSVDPEEANAYLAARGKVNAPRPKTWVPPPFCANTVAGCPNQSCPNELDAIRSFCNVSELVEFRLQELGKSPTIVRLFNRFELSIGQVNPCGLQHLVEILVLSYERGMTLDVNHLEGLLMPRGNSAIIQLSPRPNMVIITGFMSNYHSWKKHFFFVRVNNTSVEENCIPIFRTRWVRKVTNPLPPTPDGLRTVRDLLRGGPFFWAMFSLKRVCGIVTLHRSRFQPDLPVEEGAESSMDGFVPYEAPVARERSRPHKDKHVIVDNDAVVGKALPQLAVTRLTLTSCLTLNFPRSRASPVRCRSLPKHRGWSMGLLLMNRTLNVSNQEARMAQFRAETADKEIARLTDELENSHRERESQLRRRSIEPIGDERERLLKLWGSVVMGSHASLGSSRGVIWLSGIIASVAVPWADCILHKSLTIRSMSSMRGRLGVHAQQYQKQQGNPTAILIRSCKLGAFNPHGSTFLIDRQQHLFVARFLSATVDAGTSPVDRHSLTTIDRRHSSSVD
ncbi:BnaCnng04280D [Brassica napus]|uniref:BnaCnng04280D protein n=3 Tax=Brassica TaxID=3705 RepID=A0A078FKR2_BRANA|nr:BnaCnng04280D [Brassica napus]